jgi:uncharacterized membrane protein YgcG
MSALARPVRLLLAIALATVSVLAWSVLRPTPAYAADDLIESFDIRYVMQPSGVLSVTETIVWRFGDSSGRHGIERYLITREPYDDEQDAVYEIRNIDVDSPDPGVATQFSERDDEAKDGREVQKRIRIGDPDETISAPTATYVITYEVSGAMRTFSGYDEFFWDATGFENPQIRQASVTAEVPGGAQDVTCFTGPPGSKDACDQVDFSPGGSATFSQGNLPPGSGISIGVKITQGLVADNAPHLEPDGSKLTSGERAGVIGLAAAFGAVLIGSPLVGVLWWRKNGRDQRYAGLAPGTVPLAGQTAEIVAHDPDIAIPVAFTPPRIPVAEAGLLVDGQVDTRETAATIIDLAVRGALTVQSTGEDDFQVTLVDPDRAAAPHEMVLLTTLFDGQPPGATKDLSARGSMVTAHTKMRDSVRNQVASRGWFRKVPSAATAGTFGFGAIAFGIFLAFSVGAWVLWVLVPLLPILVTVAVIRVKLRRGQRTAEGRAVTDQIEGFRTYLATAEADQLRFEEGEDIFSKYLPWAIIFELADRWAKICSDLVAMGRLPDATPYWYVGTYHIGSFNTGFLTGSLTSAATPAPSSGSSGSGFGGGSSFGGGGFSGGGGGGGGSGSW